jgi:hypothetical protein
LLSEESIGYWDFLIALRRLFVVAQSGLIRRNGIQEVCTERVQFICRWVNNIAGRTFVLKVVLMANDQEVDS